MRNFNLEEFDTHVLKGKGVYVIDFYANWCMPCKMLSPIMEELEEDFPSLNFAKVDIDKNDELSIRYNIVSIPAIIIFKDAVELMRSVGLSSKEELAKIFSSLN